MSFLLFTKQVNNLIKKRLSFDEIVEKLFKILRSFLQVAGRRMTFESEDFIKTFEQPAPLFQITRMNTRRTNAEIFEEQLNGEEFSRKIRNENKSRTDFDLFAEKNDRIADSRQIFGVESTKPRETMKKSEIPFIEPLLSVSIDLVRRETDRSADSFHVDEFSNETNRPIFVTFAHRVEDLAELLKMFETFRLGKIFLSDERSLIRKFVQLDFVLRDVRSIVTTKRTTTGKYSERTQSRSSFVQRRNPKWRITDR